MSPKWLTTKRLLELLHESQPRLLHSREHKKMSSCTRLDRKQERKPFPIRELQHLINLQRK